MIILEEQTIKKIYLNRDFSWLNAIIHDDKALWKDWISCADDVDIRDETGQTPLHWACFLQRKDFVFDLLKKGADPWILDDDKLFPWLLAIQSPCNDYWDWHVWPYFFDNFAIDFQSNIDLQKQIIKMITKLNQNKRYKEIEYITQHIPCNFCQPLLLSCEKGYNIDSLIHLAYSLDSTDLLDIFLKWGCDINMSKKDKNTALDFALVTENQKWISLLIQKGAKIHSESINYMDFVNAETAGLLNKIKNKGKNTFTLEEIFIQVESEKTFDKIMKNKK